MPGFWNYLKSLFQEAEDSSPSNPLLHSMIQRSESEKADYEHWKNTLVKRRLLDWLNDQYAIYRVLPNDIDEAIDFLNTPSSKGFVIYFHKTQYSKRDVQYLFDYLKEQVLSLLNYRTQISDTRTYNRKSWVEMVERHYLKPRPNFQNEGKLKQQYGNIMIELTFRNEKTHDLKFRATSYKDHQFEEALEFKDLLQLILT